jgi:organic hydroperoxide reductase OsmC/OhrA
VQNFPHHYLVTASEGAAPTVLLESDRLPPLPSAAPAQFGGPGDRWSPETLLVAAVADCYVLTFRAVASASKLPWTTLTCDVDGTLDRVDRVTQFTRFDILARVSLPEGTDEALARRVLEKAERSCLITNSLKADIRFQAEVSVPELAGARV